MIYEMLTRRRAFDGGDVSEVMAKVITSEPDWDALPELPPALATYLRRCLQKDPRERIRDIGDVRLAMQGAFETAVSVPAEPVAVPQLRVWQRPVVISLMVLVAATTSAPGEIRRCGSTVRGYPSGSRLGCPMCAD